MRSDLCSSMFVEQQDATWTDQDTNELMLVEKINRLLLTDRNVTEPKCLLRLHYCYVHFV